MAVIVKHEIEFSNLQDLHSSFDRIADKLDSVSRSFKTDNSKLASIFRENSKKTKDLIDVFGKNIQVSKDHLQINKDLNKTLQNFNKQLQSPPKSISSQNNMLKSILRIAAGSSLLNGLSNRGSISGSSQQSLNTSIMSSTDFVQNFQAQMMNNSQQMTNTIVTATSTAIGAFLGGPIGAGIGAGIGGVVSYFGNKSNQQAISNQQFMLQQDQNAWRMSNLYGMSSTGNFQGNALGVNINDKRYGTKLSTLQAQMMNNQSLAPYANNLPTYVFNANTQQMLKEQGNIGNNVKNITTAGMSMGVSEQQMPQFINTITTTAMATGQTTNKLLNQIYDVNKSYGGDTAKNTAMTLQLMQTSHIGNFENASDLVGRYQYNPAALQNITNAANTTPMNKWLATQIGNMIGLKDGKIDEESLKKYTQLQFKSGGAVDVGALLLEQVAGYTGQNLNVSNIGIMNKVKSSGAKVEDLTTPTAAQAFSDIMIESLKNIQVGTQTVIADKVYISKGEADMWSTNMTAPQKAQNHAGNGTHDNDMVPPIEILRR